MSSIIPWARGKDVRVRRMDGQDVAAVPVELDAIPSGVETREDLVVARTLVLRVLDHRIALCVKGGDPREKVGAGQSMSARRAQWRIWRRGSSRGLASQVAMVDMVGGLWTWWWTVDLVVDCGHGGLASQIAAVGQRSGRLEGRAAPARGGR